MDTGIHIINGMYPMHRNLQTELFSDTKEAMENSDTANYWLFIPTVFCENRNLDMIREALHNELGYAVSDKYTRYTSELLAAYQLGG